ncbi:TRAP transporter substrate-binding protein DctP [Janibacter cremeus]|uniref:TRAP transporter substrate-binding protein DctP n=1 Tax=Janibacter cremeus TaxID=1285192 RepID=UPI0023F762BC|nr:TRAP transporter substrate-binding protein DctP [Janibacter cremeus]WEV78734.1 TRAP transporter substrate-binding protein DctP [Janibacter cremeus]
MLTALTLALGMTTAACGSGGGAGGDDTQTLRFATGFTSQNGWWVGTYKPWMDRVEELSEGAVEFEAFNGGELVAAGDELEALNQGIADIGSVAPPYLPDQFTAGEVTMLPLAESDVRIASKAYKALLESDEKIIDGKTYYESQFEENGLKAFPVPTTAEYTISTTGKEFNSVSAVKGLNIRASSRTHEILAESMGINPVAIPNAEAYDALNRGTLDGNFSSVADWSGYGFQDLFKYTLKGINFGHFNGTMAMTEETWNGLDPEVQEAMEQANEELYLDPGAQEWVDRADKMVKVNRESGGEFVEFDTLNPQVQELFLDGVDKTWNNYIAQLDGKGLDGEAVVSHWRDLLVEAGGEVPESAKDLN